MTYGLTMARDEVLTVRLTTSGMAAVTALARDISLAHGIGVDRSLLVRAILGEAMGDAAFMKRVTTRLKALAL